MSRNSTGHETGRAVLFQSYNADTVHQRLAGLARWTAFSARWRARQGLPLLSPLDVQYLTPQDFCNGRGFPLDPVTQRRLFRHYVQQAIAVHAPVVAAPRRVALPESADLAFVRAATFGRSFQVRHQDYLYGGRDDLGPYESEALSPTRPYGIPVVSATVQGYQMDPPPPDPELDDLVDLPPEWGMNGG